MRFDQVKPRLDMDYVGCRDRGYEGWDGESGFFHGWGVVNLTPKSSPNGRKRVGRSCRYSACLVNLYEVREGCRAGVNCSVGARE